MLVDICQWVTLPSSYGKTTCKQQIPPFNQQNLDLFTVILGWNFFKNCEFFQRCCPIINNTKRTKSSTWLNINGISKSNLVFVYTSVLIFPPSKMTVYPGKLLSFVNLNSRHFGENSLTNHHLGWPRPYNLPRFTLHFDSLSTEAAYGRASPKNLHVRCPFFHLKNISLNSNMSPMLLKFPKHLKQFGAKIPKERNSLLNSFEPNSPKKPPKLSTSHAIPSPSDLGFPCR